MLSLLLACEPSAAERLAAAEVATDIDTALAACPDAPCMAAAVARLGTWERCASIPDPWDDECRFWQAEAVERGGDAAGALDLCRDTAFHMGCATHVLGQAARRAEGIDAAASTWDELRPRTDPKLGFSYWRAWWRMGIDRGSAPGIEACRDMTCRKAAEREIEATVHQLGIPCGADRPAPGWIAEGSAASSAAWSTSVEGLCTRGEPGVPIKLEGPGRPR
ncbi:MAG: hypothetical protein FJ102_10505 [Deltaproteobacteria bacterium]|nr:hypothetical protein [Deltaproteobacteria bacterium]